MRLATAFSAQ
ncbi:hypothetical protein YPPY52_4856, partial [Yersinia pestis PY-52]